MRKRNWIAGAFCIDFAALTIWTIAQHGLSPVVWFEQLGGSWLAVCLMADLVLALGVCLVWMVRDAKSQGRQVWGYVLLTCLTGSIGPLLYIALSPKEAHKHEQNHVQNQPINALHA